MKHNEPGISRAPVDLDIRVRVSEISGRWNLNYVLNSPSGAVDFHYQEIAGATLATSPEALWRHLKRELSDLSQGFEAGGTPILNSEIPQRCTAIGRDLYRQLFNSSMRAAYRSFRDKVRTIQVTSDESWIPWELIKPYDDEGKSIIDDDFLSLRFVMTRWLSGRRLPVTKFDLQKLAFFGAGNELSLEGAEAERRLLERVASTRSKLEDVSPRVATFEAVTRLLSKTRVSLLHFVCPPSSSKHDPGLLLADQRSLHASDLIGPIQEKVRLERPIVFFNFGYHSDILEGWSRQWINECGCGAFIGPRWDIKDKSALEFAERFYDNLMSGIPLGEATHQARQHLRTKWPGDLSFLSYMVYGHPEASVLETKEARQGTSSKELPPLEIAPIVKAGLITKSIEFKPEHYLAGLAILSYFGTIVRNKYPDKGIGVRIEQQDLAIRMVIETPEGTRVELEETLEDYGQVVKGRLLPQDFLDNELQVAELRHQLRLATAQLESQRELHEIAQDLNTRRIESLGAEVDWLRSHLGDVLSLSEKHTSSIESIFANLQPSTHAEAALSSALDFIKNKAAHGLDDSDEEQIKEALQTVRKHDSNMFHSLRSKLEELIIKGAISGASGNLLYEWLKSLL